MAISHLLEALTDDLDTTVSALNLPQGTNYSTIARMARNGEITAGGGSTGIYKVASITERDALTGVHEGDMCVVTSSSIGNWEENTSSATIIFPETVTLPSAHSNYYSAQLQGDTIEGYIDLNKNGFRVDSFGNINLRVSYYSEDGIEYERERIECQDQSGQSLVDGDTITLPEEVSIQSYGDPYDENVGYFMQAGVKTFDGLFTYDGSDWNYSYVDVNTDAIDLMTNNRIYTNSGFINGVLGNTINNDYIKNYTDICNCISSWQPNSCVDLFRSNRATNLSITKLIDTSSVTSMQSMFTYCSSLTSLDVSNFNTSAVTNMNSMFYGCSSLATLDVSNFNTNNVTNMGNMFDSCRNLTNLDLSNFNTASVTNMGSMFSGCSGLTTLDLSSFNTSNVTNMYAMFKNCSSLTDLDLSSFNTSNATGMNSMFYGCGALTTLDLSSFNTSNVTDMGYMFLSCSGLTSLDLSNFNALNVTNIRGMFQGCSGLTTLKLPNFSGAVIQQTASGGITSMFESCTNLTSIDLSTLDTGSANLLYDKMFANCTSLTTIDISNLQFTGESTYQMFYNCTSLAKLDMRSFDCSSLISSGYLDMFKNVPNNCLIIVKNASMKSWIRGKWSNLTNVKTAAEYEAS